MTRSTRRRPRASAPARPLLTARQRAALRRELARHRDRRLRIALTGGPGGGKTTAADLFRREIGERVVVVPEAATLLFSGGFPRSPEPRAQAAAQQAIYHVQRQLEDVQSSLYPERILLCDRGSVDGAAYLPDPPDRFFALVGTSLVAELARYDGVIFFESAAVGGLRIEGGNPVRNESTAAAAALDARLRALWRQHPHFVLIRHEASFFHKIALALAELMQIVNDFDGRSQAARRRRDRSSG